MNTPRVYLADPDVPNWALENDRVLTRRALDGTVQFSPLATCDCIHAVWWKKLEEIAPSRLVGKRIIAHMPGEPYRYLARPDFHRAAAVVGRWVAQSEQARQQLAQVGLPSVHIPYTVDVETFRPLPPDDPALQAVRRRWQIPAAGYLISNFLRDTTADLATPNVMKGPRLFLELLRGLVARGHRIHVLLAGPRRFWMRRRLAEEGIPFTFVGERVEEDDMDVNTLPHALLNLLYNLSDLYVVSSRTEGGPRSLLEAAAARCKVVSTRVGIAPDLLEPACLFASPAEAVRIIEEDIAGGALRATVAPQAQRILVHHQPAAVAPLFRRLYDGLEQMPPVQDLPRRHMFRPRRVGTSDAGFFRPRDPARPAGARAPRVVGFLHAPGSPHVETKKPAGLDLPGALRAYGWTVEENQVRPGVQVYLLDAPELEAADLAALEGGGTVYLIHRLDGALLRAGARARLAQCMAFNARYAAHTVLPSRWALQQVVALGYQPVNPIIVPPIVDPAVFHTGGRVAFDLRRKIRLLASDRRIEAVLDAERYDLTCFQDTGSSAQRAEGLRQHDIYVATGEGAGARGVLEALACGLPVLYRDAGEHREWVGYGGLPFQTYHEAGSQLGELVAHYEAFQRLIVGPTPAEVAAVYTTLIRELP